MPTREDKNVRVCDIFMRNIVEPNNSDIFVFTDTADFYYRDTQYFLDNQVDLVNGDTHRLYDNINFISSDAAKKVITAELSNFFGSRLKGLIVSDRDDSIFKDPKYKILLDSNLGGVIPEMLVGQYKKIYNCAKMMEDYEVKNNFRYDIIFKGRFDAGYTPNSKLIFSKFDYNNVDVYVPGIRCSMVFDWYAFGNNRGMRPYLKLYDRLGEKIPPPKYAFECQRDGADWSDASPEIRNPCPNCNQIDRLTIGNITLSSENHLFVMFNELKVRYQGIAYHIYVYRYRDVNQAHLVSVENIINNNLNSVGKITVINHDLSGQINPKVHEKI